MTTVLPWVFTIVGGLVLVGATLAFWQSLRSAFGAGVEHHGVDVGVSEQRASLLDEKNALLRSIKDMEFEREVDKISEEDHERLDTRLRARAREVLRLLDEDVEPYRRKAEQLVAERLKEVEGASPYRSSAPDAGASPAVEPEPAIESEEEAAPPPADDKVRCASCETPNDPDAAFCKKCGTRMGEPEGDEAEGSSDDDEPTADAEDAGDGEERS